MTRYLSWVSFKSRNICWRKISCAARAAQFLSPKKRESKSFFSFPFPRYGKPSLPERVSKKKQALLDTEKGPSLILQPRIVLWTLKKPLAHCCFQWFPFCALCGNNIKICRCLCGKMRFLPCSKFPLSFFAWSFRMLPHRDRMESVKERAKSSSPGSLFSVWMDSVFFSRRFDRYWISFPSSDSSSSFPRSPPTVFIAQKSASRKKGGKGKCAFFFFL